MSLPFPKTAFDTFGAFDTLILLDKKQTENGIALNYRFKSKINVEIYIVTTN